MGNLLNFIEKHKYGIFVTIALHVAAFIYFQLATYQESVIYEPWDFSTATEEAPDNIVIEPDQIQTLQEQKLIQPEKITSFVKNKNDQRERSTEMNEEYTSFSENDRSASDIEREFTENLEEQFRNDREEQLKQMKADIEENNNQNKTEENVKQGDKASNNAVGGATMVTYSLLDRHPLNHNDWYVRNPGYTCGNVNGMVRVRITVNKGGHVINAEVSASKNATSCMKNKAKEYALKSRFNFAENALSEQQGTITYQFVYRN